VKRALRRGTLLAAAVSLALSGAASAASDAGPRAAARQILSESRFHGTTVPGPFRGLLRWLGRRLGWLGRLVRWIDGLVPGPRWVVWLVLSALVAAVAGLVARRSLALRVRAARTAAAAAAPADADPRALERRAEAAEAAGDLEAALRLRFRAGLLRLDARGAIDFRPSISTREVRRALRSADFDAVADTFDDVVYGGRPAGADDLAAARRRWAEIVRAA
jgi:hypothetical protein